MPAVKHGVNLLCFWAVWEPMTQEMWEIKEAKWFNITQLYKTLNFKLLQKTKDLDFGLDQLPILSEYVTRH